MGLLDFANNGLLGVAKNRVNKYAGLLGGAVDQGVAQLQSEYGAPGTDKFRENIMNMAMNFAPVTATVFHGSPHKFDAFDMSKIGTGEGAQAYGHGLYFADNPSVARGYQEKLSDAKFKIDGAPMPGNSDPVIVATQIQQMGGSGAKAYFQAEADKAASLAQQYGSQKMQAIADNFKKWMGMVDDVQARKFEIEQGGSLYTVDLPDEAIAKMLDWDKPLSQQAPEVRDYIKSSDPRLKRLFDSGKIDEMYQNGGEFYRALMGKHSQDAPLHVSADKAEDWYGQRAASSQLNNLGIPGIRYLDGSSRRAGTGTRNYVVFDDKLPKILKRE